MSDDAYLRPDADYEAESASLAEQTGLDVRSVAVIWSNGTSGASEEDGYVEGPKLVLNGCSEYEAVGLLRAALSKLERLNRKSVGYDNDEVDDDEEEDSL